MPAIHERVFRVRFYECDAYGHMNNANYLRLMQEAAFDASSEVGYDGASYDALGHFWLIRETDIEYLSPLKQDDCVIVRTWVEDFRRVRSRRAYEFIHQGRGEVVAKASTDWIYLNAQTLRPALIPEKMAFAFWPEGPPEEGANRKPFPTPAEAPEEAYSYTRGVEWRDIDPMGHVNNAVYLSYVEEAGIAVSQHLGWRMQRMMDEGFGLVARRHRIEYRQPAMMNQVLRVSTWVSDMRRVSATRHTLIQHDADESLLARANTTWVWIDIDSGRPIRIPPDFMQDFAGNMVD